MAERLREFSEGCGFKPFRPWKAGADGARPRRCTFGPLGSHRDAFLTAMRIDPAHHEWPEGGAND
jgi:hypothetical protein